jgi:hypothetical protein
VDFLDRLEEIHLGNDKLAGHHNGMERKESVVKGGKKVLKRAIQLTREQHMHRKKQMKCGTSSLRAGRDFSDRGI